MKTINVNIAQVQPQDQDPMEVTNYVFTIS